MPTNIKFAITKHLTCTQRGNTQERVWNFYVSYDEYYIFENQLDLQSCLDGKLSKH